MTTTPTGANPAREKLKKGELAIGVGLRQARTVDIAPAMKTCGYDWLFIDCEHNSMTLDMAVQISVTANACGISPIVRVPQGQLDMATRVLDGGLRHRHAACGYARGSQGHCRPAALSANGPSLDRWNHAATGLCATSARRIDQNRQ
ncbi:MAG: hypothetical protein R3D67_12425 [Hyphomicrobiaceae bacterium]